MYLNLPLLDRVGSNYQCRSRSFILGDHILSLATYLARLKLGAYTFLQGNLEMVGWGDMVVLTSLALSMTVNTLVTGLIVFKIFKASLEINAVTSGTSDEQTLGTIGGSKLKHVIFIIIESGMALLAVQLVRVTLYNQPVQSDSTINAYIIFIGINEMFNGIAPTMILLRVSMRLSLDDEESFIDAAGSLRFNDNPQSDSNTVGNQERSEDIGFNNPSNDPNTLQRLGRSSSQDLLVGEE